MWKTEKVFVAQGEGGRNIFTQDLPRAALAHAAGAVPPVLLEAAGDAEGPSSRTLLLLTSKLTPVLPLSQ